MEQLPHILNNNINNISIGLNLHAVSNLMATGGPANSMRNPDGRGGNVNAPYVAIGNASNQKDYSNNGNGYYDGGNQPNIYQMQQHLPQGHFPSHNNAQFIGPGGGMGGGGGGGASQHHMHHQQSPPVNNRGGGGGGNGGNYGGNSQHRNIVSL